MFSQDLNTVLSYATDEAMRTGHKSVRSDHLMLALLRQKGSVVCQTLEALGVNLERFKKMLDASLFIKDPVSFDERDNIKPSKEALSSLQAAVYESMKTRDKETSPLHLLIGLVQNTFCFTWIYLKEQGIGVYEIKEAVKKTLPKPNKKPGQNNILIQKLNSSLGEQLTRIHSEIVQKTNFES